MQPRHRFGRGAKQSPSDERKLVMIFKKTTKAQPFHELEASGTPASLSTLKEFFITMDWESDDQERSQKWTPSSSPDKPNAFWRNGFWSDETKIDLFAHNKKSNLWRNKGEVLKHKTTVPTAKHGDGSIMLCDCFGASDTGKLHKVDGKMTKEHYLQIPQPISNQQVDS